MDREEEFRMARRHEFVTEMLVWALTRFGLDEERARFLQQARLLEPGRRRRQVHHGDERPTAWSAGEPLEIRVLQILHLAAIDLVRALRVQTGLCQPRLGGVHALLVSRQGRRPYRSRHAV